MSNAEFVKRLTTVLEAFGSEDLHLIVDLVVVAAYADGEIDATEREAVRLAAETAFGQGVDDAALERHIKKSKSQIKAAGGDTFARELGRTLASKRMAEQGLRVAFTVAQTSDGVSDEERARLAVLAEGAGLSASAVQTIERTLAGAV